MSYFHEEYLGLDFIDSNTELHPYFFGTEHCKPEHFHGPAVRDHFLIHYIHSGKCIFHVGGNIYHLEKGQGFLICPGIITFYESDHEQPLVYSWVGFHGLKAETYLNQAKLSIQTPVFTYRRDSQIENFFEQMLEASKLKKSKEIRLTSLLYLFMSLLIENSESDHVNNKKGKDLYIKMALEFITMNYSRKITIEDLADYVGISRKYMSTLFKNVLNISPQEFLMTFRIDKACALMMKEELSIGDISRSVGYDDQLLFSKVFKKAKNICPKDYRKNLLSIFN